MISSLPYKTNEATLSKLLLQYPYYEAGYITKAMATQQQPDLHNAALFLDNPYQLYCLLHKDNMPVALDTEKQDTAIPTTTPTLNAVVEAPAGAISTTATTNNEVSDTIIQDDIATKAAVTTPIQKMDTNETVLDIPIDPYHTVDYFASQGIKLSESALGKDKLSVQLKSFTAWLKTMKKVDTTVVPENEQINDNQHSTVVSLAEESLTKNDILTESMVDVLIKQGKTNEAIGLLQKLSLQDTAKSAYFAARIEQIKLN